MAVALLDSPNTAVALNGDPGAVTAGSNRVAIIIVGLSYGDDTRTLTMTSCSYGGQTCTELIQAEVVSCSKSLCAWYLNEAGIAAMSGSTTSIAENASTGNTYRITFSGVDQTTPFEGIGAAGANFDTSYTISALAKTLDGYRVGAAQGASDNTHSSLNPPLVFGEWDATRALKIAVLGEAVTATGTEDTTWTQSSATDSSLLAWSLKPVSAGATTQLISHLGTYGMNTLTGGFRQ